MLQLQYDENFELYDDYILTKDRKHLMLFITPKYPMKSHWGEVLFNSSINHFTSLPKPPAPNMAIFFISLVFSGKSFHSGLAFLRYSLGFENIGYRKKNNFKVQQQRNMIHIVKIKLEFFRP